MEFCIWNELNGSVKELNMFHNYETEKITRKASDAAENLQLYGVVQFFRPRSLCTTTHLMLFSERPQIFASCMSITGGRTKQLYIIAGFLPRHWLYEWFSCAKNVRRYMRQCTTISGGRTEELDIIVGFLPHHWLYEWFSQFHSCGKYSVLSRSPSIVRQKLSKKTLQKKFSLEWVFESGQWCRVMNGVWEVVGGLWSGYSEGTVTQCWPSWANRKGMRPTVALDQAISEGVLMHGDDRNWKGKR